MTSSSDDHEQEHEHDYEEATAASTQRSGPGIFGPGMEIHQLRYFVAVAEESSSSSRAAQREHVSQPSLSQQIHKLEEELNQQLFDRLPRSVVLTAAGKCLLPYARVVLTAIADAGRAVTALEAEVAGRLAVGAIPSIALYILPRLIGKFQHAYPKVTFEIFEDTTGPSWPSNSRTGRSTW